MARKVSDAVDAAIRAMVRDGQNGRQIRDQLAAGFELLTPTEIPLRTVQDRAAKHRRAWESERDPLEEMSEVDAVDAVLRDYIRAALKEANRFKTAQKKGKQLSVKDAELMRTWAKTLSECQRHFDRKTGSRSHKPGEEKGRQITQASTLDRLASNLEPASTDHPPTNARTYARTGDDVSQPTFKDRDGRDAGDTEATNETSGDDAPHSVSRSLANVA